MKKTVLIQVPSSEAMSDHELKDLLYRASEAGLAAERAVLSDITAYDILRLAAREKALQARLQELEDKLMDIADTLSPAPAIYGNASKLGDTDVIRHAWALVREHSASESSRQRTYVTKIPDVPMKHFKWCHPGDQNRQLWMLMFDDADRGTAIYYDEPEALAAFSRAEGIGFNCHLLTSVPRTKESQESPA
jgi:hypothetical protein